MVNEEYVIKEERLNEIIDSNNPTDEQLLEAGDLVLWLVDHPFSTWEGDSDNE